MWEGMGHGFVWICVDLGFGPGNKKIGNYPNSAFTVGFLAACPRDLGECRPGVPRVGACSKLCTGIANGDGRVAPVQTKCSPTQLLMVKHICFDNFFLQDASGPPVVALASQSSSQMPPTYPPNASQTPPEVPKEVWVRLLGS